MHVDRLLRASVLTSKAVPPVGGYTARWGLYIASFCCPMFTCFKIFFSLKKQKKKQLLNLFKLAVPSFPCLQSSDLFKVNTFDNLHSVHLSEY